MNDQNSALSVYKKWKIGDVTITRVQEMATLTLDPEWLLKINAEQVRKFDWLRPDHATDEGHIKANIQAFIIEAGGKRIMVDPCIGNHKPREGALFNMLDNPFLERLSEAGFPPESIDFVLCTHLHVDHCGWNTRLVDGRWVPTFENAQYLFAKREYEHSRTDKGDEQEATYADSIKPIVDAGLAKLVDFDHHILDEVWLEPTPGHTPGHCCVRIRSKGSEAVITGDLMHHPVQAAAPDVCSNYCWDEEQVKRTRRSFLDGCARSATLVLGTHFAEPTGVRVVTDGDAWRMKGA